MRRRWLMLGAAVVALPLAAVTAGHAASSPPLSITPIESVFSPTQFATQYEVKPVGAGDRHVTYAWTLQLVLVDPAGSSSPAAPDSHAAVDTACDNSYLPGGKPDGGETFTWANHGPSFVWFHGDKGTYSGSSYGCVHAKMGPKGHQGIVTVVATGGGWRCVASIEGSNLSPAPERGGPPRCTEIATAATPTTTAAAAPPATTTVTATATPVAASGGGGFPIWIPIVAVLALLAAGGVWFARSRGGAADDCAELRARCKELQAAAAAAAKDAAAAEARAKSARAEYDKARAARESAQRSADAADHPDEGASWIEDADTGERITEHDLALQKQDPSGRWADPARRKELRDAERAKAHAALDAANQAEATAKAASDAAAAAAQKADAAAAHARADAAAACKAADECEAAAAAAKAAAEQEARRQQEEAERKKAAEEEQRRVDEAKRQEEARQAQRAADAAAAAAAAEARRKAQEEYAHRRECEDDWEPETTTESEELEMYVLALADVKIDGVFQFSSDDVEKALRGFENFKTVADIAEFVEGFGESAGGDVVSGTASVDTILNTVTELVNQGFDASGNTNLVDPQSATEDSVTDALNKLIEKVNAKRALGDWTMRCPLMKVTATCEKTRECRNGRWVVTKHTFTLAYGPKIRDGVATEQNLDNDRPGRGAMVARTALNRHFTQLNRDANRRLAELVKGCAAGR